MSGAEPLTHRGDTKIELRSCEARARLNWDDYQPTNLLVYKRALFLVGRIGASPKVYVLAVERIREAELGETFPPPADWSVDTWLAGRFGLTSDNEHPEPEEVVLRFTADMALYVRDRAFHPSQVLEEIRDGQVRLRLQVTGRELVPFVLQWGPKVVVEAPAWLRKAVAAELSAALLPYV